MKKIYGILMMFIAFFAMTSCSEDTPSGEAKEIVPNPSELVFLATGAEAQTVSFVANAEWKASTEQGWIQIANPVGKGGENTLSVSVKDNETNSKREGTLSITDKVGKTAIVKIIQKAGDYSIKFGKPSGVFLIDNENRVISDTLVVDAEVPYTLQFSDDWVTYDDVTLKNENKIIFKILNDKIPLEEKETKVIFSANDGSESPEYNIKWEKIEPFLEFYLDSDCMQPINEIMISKDYSPAIFIKSNLPWLLDYKNDSFINSIDVRCIDGIDNSIELPNAFTSISSIVINYVEKIDAVPSINLNFKTIGIETSSNFKVSRVGGGQIILIEPFEEDDKHDMFYRPMFSTEYDDSGLDKINITIHTNIEELGVFALTQGMESSIIYDRFNLESIESVPSDKYPNLQKKTFELSLKPDNENRRDFKMFSLYFAKEPKDSSKPLYEYYVEEKEEGGFGLKWPEELGDLFISDKIELGELSFKKPFKNIIFNDVTIAAEGGEQIIEFETDEIISNYEVYTSLKVEFKEGEDGFIWCETNELSLGEKLLDLVGSADNGAWFSSVYYDDNRISLNVNSNENKERILDVYIVVKYDFNMQTRKTKYQQLGKFRLTQSANITK